MIKIFFLLLVSFGTIVSGFSQIHSFDSDKSETISRKDFDIYIERYINFIENESQLTIDDYILMIKLKNSIAFSNIKNINYKNYEMLFYNKMLLKIIDELECGLSVGMGYYCPKYTIFIAGKPDSKSRFRIID